MVKSRYWLYKTYLVVKIMYLVFMLGHLTGCIFYAID